MQKGARTNPRPLSDYADLVSAIDTDVERVISVTVEIHAVASSTVVERTAGNFPVTICFDLTADVTHECPHVLDTEPAECLLRSDVIAAGEMVEYTTLLS